MTKRALPGASVPALTIALALLAGCKITDDKVDTGFTGENGVRDPGSAPTIWGDPHSTVLVGANYAFQPEAEDADGDVLEFSIANKPGWASFDANSGLLQGIPGSRHTGVTRNIVVSVSDGDSIISMPSFDLRVDTTVMPDDPDDGPDDGGIGGGSISAPPSISGTPNTSVVVGQDYLFRAEVTDPDSESLSFSIVNRPRWMNFNTTTGRLRGTPSDEHIGSSRLIEISVTDGTSIAALPRFRITVEAVGTVSKALAWTPPTQNEDGTPLTDLAGYRIYYGTAPGEYSEVIELNSPGVTSYVIGNLSPGTYYLAMTSVNSVDLESRHTPEISFSL